MKLLDRQDLGQAIKRRLPMRFYQAVQGTGGRWARVDGSCYATDVALQREP